MGEKYCCTVHGLLVQVVSTIMGRVGLFGDIWDFTVMTKLCPGACPVAVNVKVPPPVMLVGDTDTLTLGAGSGGAVVVVGGRIVVVVVGRVVVGDGGADVVVSDP